MTEHRVIFDEQVNLQYKARALVCLSAGRWRSVAVLTVTTSYSLCWLFLQYATKPYIRITILWLFEHLTFCSNNPIRVYKLKELKLRQTVWLRRKKTRKRILKVSLRYSWHLTSSQKTKSEKKLRIRYHKTLAWFLSKKVSVSNSQFFFTFCLLGREIGRASCRERVLMPV